MKLRIYFFFFLPAFLIFYTTLLFSQEFKTSNYDNDIRIAKKVHNPMNSFVGGGEDEDEGEDEFPFTIALQQNYPNPFNTSTTFHYASNKSGFVSIKVYDVLGNLITVLYEENRRAGVYSVIFDGTNFSSGIYFYNVTINGLSETKPMILLK